MTDMPNWQCITILLEDIQKFINRSVSIALNILHMYIWCCIHKQTLLFKSILYCLYGLCALYNQHVYIKSKSWHGSHCNFLAKEWLTGLWSYHCLSQCMLHTVSHNIIMTIQLCSFQIMLLMLTANKTVIFNPQKQYIATCMHWCLLLSNFVFTHARFCHALSGCQIFPYKCIYD